MRNYTSKYLIFLVITFFFIFSSCSNSSNSDDNDPDYKVSFTLNGTNYTFTTAHDNPSGFAEGSISETKTLIVADSADIPENYVYFNIPGITAGTFNESTVGNPCFEYVIPAGNNFLDPEGTINDFTFTISVIESEGGIIKGTFYGTVYESGTPATTYPLTNGFFEVLRVASIPLD